MFYTTEDIVQSLINNIKSVDGVKSIGISGSKDAFPKQGEGDIDIFIYCDSIPDNEKRQGILAKMGDLVQGSRTLVFEGGHWGTGDFCLINGVETWLMYFTIDETIVDMEAILKGEYPDKLDNYYYPVGRCAMLKNMSIFYDREGFLNSIKERLSIYPEDLAKSLAEYHIEEIDDIEDLERAVSRGDVLFYHFAIDIALDHYLQALFSLNKTFFPSRKRTLSFIERFKIKPDKCGERLLEVIKLGSEPQTIEKSYKLWIGLTEELKELCNGGF